MKISLVIPAYNEEQNILPLYKVITKTLKDFDYEIIFVNDGSTDKTLSAMQSIQDKKLIIINLEKHQGKSFALYTGLRVSSQIIATLDADLQNHPQDIIKLLKKIDQGYDFVCGWRIDRQDSISKKIFSKFSNITVNIVLKTGFHDINCPLRVFKKDCIEKIKFFKNYHRFLPFLIKAQGYKVCQEKINHYRRMHGRSKYGLHNRIFGNLKTLLILKNHPEKFLK